MKDKKDVSEKKWKDILNQEEFKILREKGTESPFSGIYNTHFEDGTYFCTGCNAPLFKSESKFNSGCGWPSFDASISGSIKYSLDKSLGMIRTEILCNNCNGHLGHVFNDGPTDSGSRYCVNSISLDFKKS